MMLNTYRYTFKCDCLVDGKTIWYTLEIKTLDQLMVEDIIGFSPDGPSIQESIADKFYARFGGEQTITGTHSGVEVVTHRGCK